MKPTHKTIAFFLLLYGALRIFSYFFQPDTPLHAASLVNTTVGLAWLLATGYWLLRRNVYGWYLIGLEIILGGSGGYLALFGLSLRTCLLGTSLTIYFAQKVFTEELKPFLKKYTSELWILGLLLCVALMAALRGLAHAHASQLVFADTIPYLFLLYYFPLSELLATEDRTAYDETPSSVLPLVGGGMTNDATKGLQNSLPNPARGWTPLGGISKGRDSGLGFTSLAINALMAAVIGNCLLILFTFIGFSSTHFVLQDVYYHWYRDVALGKITELPFHFYRLILNEQLLLVPVLLWLLSSVIARRKIERRPDGGRDPDSPSGQSPIFSKKSHLDDWGLLRPPTYVGGLAMTLLIALATNFTRSYILALAVGLLFLFNRQRWKRWFITSSLVLVLFFASFTAIHLIASRGQSLGWELFGLRLQSIASPELEDSSLSRLLLLPKILEKIKQHPLLGNGLGDTITVYSPVLKQTITTPHFDWGYLEIIDELGLLGLIAWGVFVSCILIGLKKTQAPRWLMASLMSLLIINLTSPALFHVLGLIWLMTLLAQATTKQNPCNPYAQSV